MIFGNDSRKKALIVKLMFVSTSFAFESENFKIHFHFEDKMKNHACLRILITENILINKIDSYLLLKPS